MAGSRWNFILSNGCKTEIRTNQTATNSMINFKGRIIKTIQVFYKVNDCSLQGFRLFSENQMIQSDGCISFLRYVTVELEANERWIGFVSRMDPKRPGFHYDF